VGGLALIVLDTATWIWLVSDPDRLSPAAKEAVAADGQPAVSAISAWEVGMLVSKGRISLDRPVDRWINEAMGVDRVAPTPIDHHIAILATLLPAEAPTDPADRLIIATTLRLGGLLVTPDTRIRQYPFCPTLW
jgi:PIN domain nuclease of toxin-antitoxin system